MVYLPAVFDDYNIRQFDFVLLDEAQDTNAARRELARRMLKPGGRICAVGDRYQALYAFTGADTESLDRIMEEFDAVSMPLSVSYRCPKSVVVEAQKHVPHIQAHPSAPDGDVQHLTISRDTDITNVFGSKDAIICRYNAPIIRLACRLIQAGVSCRVEGRDIGRMMSDLLRKACPDEDAGSEQMREGMASWLQDQMQQAAKRASDSAARIAQDKYDTVLALIDRAEITHGRKATRADVVSVIEALFADDVKDRLVLSTIHKAKGREWPYVFWLQTSERQSHKPPQEWEVQTEICCKYVAITRAQKTLIYLSDTSHD
jgi:superfamily I DNA/RNA helicase